MHVANTAVMMIAALMWCAASIVARVLKVMVWCLLVSLLPS